MVRRVDFSPAAMLDGAGVTSESILSERVFSVRSNMRALWRTVPSERRQEELFGEPVKPRIGGSRSCVRWNIRSLLRTAP
jgi:hypothetical protein